MNGLEQYHYRQGGMDNYFGKFSSLFPRFNQENFDTEEYTLAVTLDNLPIAEIKRRIMALFHEKKDLQNKLASLEDEVIHLRSELNKISLKDSHIVKGVNENIGKFQTLIKECDAQIEALEQQAEKTKSFEEKRGEKRKREVSEEKKEMTNEQKVISLLSRNLQVLEERYETEKKFFDETIKEERAKSQKSKEYSDYWQDRVTVVRSEVNQVFDNMEEKIKKLIEENQKLKQQLGEK